MNNKQTNRINEKIAVVFAFFFLLCTAGAISLFFGCENHWIIGLTDHMWCDVCDRPKEKCICVDEPLPPPPSDAKAITAFTFSSPPATGVVNETAKTISVTVPFGTDVTNLTPTVTHTGANYSPVGAQDFTDPVTYTVTAADSSKQDYTVTITVAAANTYLVTVNAGTGGAASASPSGFVAPGTTVTLTATANYGYSFSGWTVNSGGIALSSAAANPAIFTMPGNAVEVTANFAVDHEHDWEWTLTTYPTQTTKGIETGICSVCGTTRTREFITDNIEDGLTYTLTLNADGTYTITGAESLSGAIFIPGWIHDAEGNAFPITKIADFAFFENSSIEKVTIGEGIDTIGNAAFYWTYITSVEIPSTVTIIGDGAFAESKSLKEVTIPASVETIGNNAFERCWGLESITIKGATAIGNNAFTTCSSLTSVTFMKDDATIANDNSFPYGASLRTAYAAGGAGTYVLIDGIWAKEGTYTVTFNSMGGTYVAPITPITGLTSGSTITTPTPAREAAGFYEFEGWYRETTLTNKWTAGDTVTSNITLYAKWTPLKSVGEDGPGGGKIFHVAPNGFTVEGYGNPGDSDYFPTYTAYYLEAAAADEGLRQWQINNTDIQGTSRSIGAGRKNTSLILAADPNAPAAKAADEYSSNGMEDWFLPSRDELEQLHINKNLINSPSDRYWASDQVNSNDAYGRNFNSVHPGGETQSSKNSLIGGNPSNRVWPIRAF